MLPFWKFCRFYFLDLFRLQFHIYYCSNIISWLLYGIATSNYHANMEYDGNIIIHNHNNKLQVLITPERTYSNMMLTPLRLTHFIFLATTIKHIFNFEIGKGIKNWHRITKTYINDNWFTSKHQMWIIINIYQMSNFKFKFFINLNYLDVLQLSISSHWKWFHYHIRIKIWIKTFLSQAITSTFFHLNCFTHFYRLKSWPTHIWFTNERW